MGGGEVGLVEEVRDVACDANDIQLIRCGCASVLVVLTFFLRCGFVNRNGKGVSL